MPGRGRVWLRSPLTFCLLSVTASVFAGWWRMAGWTTRGLSAGVSTVLAFLAGALTNVFTQGWSWSVGVGLGVLLVGWVGWEMRQAARFAPRQPVDGSDRDAADEHAVPGRSGSRGPVVQHQLPAAVRYFAGREAELAALSELLDQSRAGAGGTVVISAIGGAAGVGKTALAIYWAHRVADRFPDGQLYVNLRGFDPTGSVVAPAEAVRRFLDALGVAAERIPADLDALAALYRSELVGRRMLIVLDNARDTTQVRPLLPGAATCLVVVTSRNQLSGLVAGQDAYPINLDLLTVAEARELLARRVGTNRVSAEPDAVEEIITRCARLPLALAVVAARVAARPQLPMAALVGELRDARDRLDVLVGDDPYTDVRAVLSWSYRALTPDAARLFRLLGLHPGPDLSMPAAASLAALPQPRVRALLFELTRANLLVEHVAQRYVFHDLLRAYATDLTHTVDSDDQRRAATLRTLDHYLHTAHAAAWLLFPYRDPITPAAAEPGVTPEQLTDERQARAWFTAEQAVLIAAVDHAAGNGFDVHTWQLACAHGDFLDRRGHWNDHAATGRAAVSAADRLADPTAQGRAHLYLAIPYIWLGRHDDADIHLHRALDLAVQADDPVGQGRIHAALSLVRERQGRYTDAFEHSEQALALSRSHGHRHGQAMDLNNFGWDHALLGDHELALTYCQQALTQLQALGNRYGEAAAWDSLGYAHHHLGHHAEAITCYQRAIDLARDLGDPYNVAGTLVHLGDTHNAAGDPHAARDIWQQAVSILDDLDHPDADEVRTKLATLDTPTDRSRPRPTEQPHQKQTNTPDRRRGLSSDVTTKKGQQSPDDPGD
jgi:tetratricopeptide (TPR) repeat protein